MSEVPYGVLLSGGLDSSLIASIAARETDKLAEIQENLRKERRAAIAEGKDLGQSSGSSLFSLSLHSTLSFPRAARHPLNTNNEVG